MTILQALGDRNLFGGLPQFRDLSTWRAWLVFLAAVYGRPFRELEPLGVSEADALALFQAHTGRTVYTPPAGGYSEAAAIVGRQAGKDRVASLVQAYEAATATPEADGSDIYALSIAQDARAALRTQLSYARAPFKRIPLFAQLVKSSKANEIELTTGMTLAAYPCRPAAVRGLRARIVVMTEIAFFRNADGNPVDVGNAFRSACVRLSPNDHTFEFKAAVMSPTVSLICWLVRCRVATNWSLLPMPNRCAKATRW